MKAYRFGAPDNIHDPQVQIDANRYAKHCSSLGGFPIEIETKISKLITYSLAIFMI